MKWQYLTVRSSVSFWVLSTGYESENPFCLELTNSHREHWPTGAPHMGFWCCQPVFFSLLSLSKPNINHLKGKIHPKTLEASSMLRLLVACWLLSLFAFLGLFCCWWCIFHIPVHSWSNLDSLMSYWNITSVATMGFNSGTFFSCKKTPK